MTKFRAAAAIALLAAPVAIAQAPKPANEEEARWWQHVQALADDTLEGRRAGSEGYRKAAAYVVAQFEQAGLKPAGSKGFLPERRIFTAAHRRGSVARRGGPATASRTCFTSDPT